MSNSNPDVDEAVSEAHAFMDAAYLDLLNRLNHAPTGHFTCSDIAFLTQTLELELWRVTIEQRPLRVRHNPRRAKRLAELADKAGV